MIIIVPSAGMPPVRFYCGVTVCSVRGGIGERIIPMGDNGTGQRECQVRPVFELESDRN